MSNTFVCRECVLKLDEVNFAIRNWDWVCCGLIFRASLEIHTTNGGRITINKRTSAEIDILYDRFTKELAAYRAEHVK